MNIPRTVKPWSLVVVAATTVLALFAPLHAVGQFQMPQYILILDHFISLVMVADLVLRWRSAGSIQAYGGVWILADLCAAIPFGLLTGVPVLELLRLAKLGRVVQTMRELWSTYIDKWNTFRLVYSGFWIAIVVHWLACGWLALRGVSAGAFENEKTYIRAW